MAYECRKKCPWLLAVILWDFTKCLCILNIFLHESKCKSVFFLYSHRTQTKATSLNKNNRTVVDMNLKSIIRLVESDDFLQSVAHSLFWISNMASYIFLEKRLYLALDHRVPCSDITLHVISLHRPVLVRTISFTEPPILKRKAPIFYGIRCESDRFEYLVSRDRLSWYRR